MRLLLEETQGCSTKKEVWKRRSTINEKEHCTK